MVSITQKKRDQSVPWVEKYRPHSLDDVVDQPEVVSSLRTTISKGDLPHLLFHGPAGTGKTSTILAVCNDLFGPIARENVVELNASDERGINVIRERVKESARLLATKKVPGYPCPPFKVIILDEADALTPDAQAALRRVMEQFSKSTRMCLICNYVSRIADPILSRCARYRFKPLPAQSVKERLNHIIQKEGLEVPDQVVDSVRAHTGGDLRRAVTLLQAVCRTGVTKPGDVDRLAGKVSQEVVRNALEFTSPVRGADARMASNAAFGVVKNATPCEEFVRGVAKWALDPRTGLSGQVSGFIVQRCALAERALVDGSSEYIQLTDLFLRILAVRQQAGC